LPDSRAGNAWHDLLEVLFIARAVMLCGAESCSDMADFGQSKEEPLRLFLRLEHGIPSRDTFSRAFRLLKPQAFERAFRRFMAALASQPHQVDWGGESPRQNGPRLSRHTQRVIITVARY